MSRARAVLGDLDADDLGVTYLHEHLVIDHPLVVDRFPDISLPSVEDAVGEVGRCAATGVGTMVDTMPCAAGRNVDKLAEVSRRTGVAVVASTGLHTAKYYVGAPWATSAAPEVLADLFVADITEGIDRFDYTGPVVERTSHRAGIVKAATSGDEPTDAERRLLEGVAITHERTGAPVITHCEGGKGGLAQVTVLADLGVDLSQVVLSHTDKIADEAYHRDLLATGVNLEYDQLLRDPGPSVRLLEAMIADGRLPQLMLGTDGARRSLWTELGGSPGLAHLPATLDPHFPEPVCRTLLIENPARFLGFLGP